MWKIVQNNRSTFYNYNNEEVYGIRLRLAFQFLCALALGAIFSSNSGNFLNASITALAILVGFSFSVLFFLISIEPDPHEKSHIMEVSELSKKLTKLSKEIFHNVSYFNFISIICVLSALLLLLPIPSFALIRTLVEQHVPWADISLISQTKFWIFIGLEKILFVVFYFLLIECVFTFVRTVFRINYLFEKKMELRKIVSSNP